MKTYKIQLDDRTADRLEWQARQFGMNPDFSIDVVIRRELGLTGDRDLEDEMVSRR